MAANFSSQFSTGQSTQRSRSRPAIIPGVMNIYNARIKEQEQNAQQAMTGYQQMMQNLNSQVNSVAGGYDTGKQNVMKLLGFGDPSHPFGVATPAAAQIQQNAAQVFGQEQQQMINSGMGNSTVLAGMRTANQLAANQAMAGLGSSMQQTAAGYEGQFDLAKQGALMQGMGLENQLSNTELGGMWNWKPQNLVGSLTGQFSSGSGQSTQQSQGYGIGVNSPMGGSPSGGGMPPMDTSGVGNVGNPYALDSSMVLGGTNPGQGNYGDLAQSPFFGGKSNTGGGGTPNLNIPVPGSDFMSYIPGAGPAGGGLLGNG